jgi:hypothetical protein
VVSSINKFEQESARSDGEHPRRSRSREPDDLATTAAKRRTVVCAALPKCPRCGVKDRARVKGGTHRPFGNSNPRKIQYVCCDTCGFEYSIDWF